MSKLFFFDHSKVQEPVYRKSENGEWMPTDQILWLKRGMPALYLQTLYSDSTFGQYNLYLIGEHTFMLNQAMVSETKPTRGA